MSKDGINGEDFPQTSTSLGGPLNESSDSVQVGVDIANSNFMEEIQFGDDLPNSDAYTYLNDKQKQRVATTLHVMIRKKRWHKKSLCPLRLTPDELAIQIAYRSPVRPAQLTWGESLARGQSDPFHQLAVRHALQMGRSGWDKIGNSQSTWHCPTGEAIVTSRKAIYPFNNEMEEASHMLALEVERLYNNLVEAADIIDELRTDDPMLPKAAQLTPRYGGSTTKFKDMTRQELLNSMTILLEHECRMGRREGYRFGYRSGNRKPGHMGDFDDAVIVARKITSPVNNEIEMAADHLLHAVESLFDALVEAGNLIDLFRADDPNWKLVTPNMRDIVSLHNENLELEAEIVSIKNKWAQSRLLDGELIDDFEQQVRSDHKLAAYSGVATNYTVRSLMARCKKRRDRRISIGEQE